MMKNKKNIYRLIKTFIILYCVAGIAMYSFQDDILFHPVKLDRSYSFHFDQPFEEITVPFNKEDTLSMMRFFPANGASNGVVIYFHGNKRNVERFAPFAKVFTSKGFEVWMPDYPGYGKSTGAITENKLLDQAAQVQLMAAAKFDSAHIILYGKSLGSGIAAHTAAVSANRMLILETPYYSIPDIFNAYSYVYPTSTMIKYKLPTHEFLQDTKEKVVVIAGGDDWIIPYRCTVKLKPYMKPGDLFVTIPKTGHNSLNLSPEYYRLMDSLLSF